MLSTQESDSSSLSNERKHDVPPVKLSYDNFADKESGLLPYLASSVKDLIRVEDDEALQQLINDIAFVADSLYDLNDEIVKARKHYEQMKNKREAIRQSLEERQNAMKAIESEMQAEFGIQPAHHPFDASETSLSSLVGEEEDDDESVSSSVDKNPFDDIIDVSDLNEIINDAGTKPISDSDDNDKQDIGNQKQQPSLSLQPPYSDVEDEENAAGMLAHKPVPINEHDDGDDLDNIFLITDDILNQSQDNADDTVSQETDHSDMNMQASSPAFDGIIFNDDIDLLLAENSSKDDSTITPISSDAYPLEIQDEDVDGGYQPPGSLDSDNDDANPMVQFNDSSKKLKTNDQEQNLRKMDDHPIHDLLDSDNDLTLTDIPAIETNDSDKSDDQDYSSLFSSDDDVYEFLDNFNEDMDSSEASDDDSLNEISINANDHNSNEKHPKKEKNHEKAISQAHEDKNTHHENLEEIIDEDFLPNTAFIDI